MAVHSDILAYLSLSGIELAQEKRVEREPEWQRQ